MLRTTGPYKWEGNALPKFLFMMQENPFLPRFRLFHLLDENCFVLSLLLTIRNLKHNPDERLDNAPQPSSFKATLTPGQ